QLDGVSPAGRARFQTRQGSHRRAAGMEAREAKAPGTVSRIGKGASHASRNAGVSRTPPGHEHRRLAGALMAPFLMIATASLYDSLALGGSARTLAPQSRS